MELRLTKAQKDKIRSEVSELIADWQETSKQDRHEFRQELTRIIGSQDRDIRENRSELRKIRSIVDRNYRDGRDDDDNVGKDQQP